MTADEAVQGAQQRHELRTIQDGVLDGGQIVYWWVCWCGNPISSYYPTEAQARAAHERHQSRSHR